MRSPLNPLSELARRASPDYTVTYLLTVAFGFAGACVVSGIFVQGLAQLALIGCGILTGASTFGFFAYLVLQKLEVFRSEPHLRFLAIMAWSEDPNLDEEAVRRRERVLPALLAGGVSKTESTRHGVKEADQDE